MKGTLFTADFVTDSSNNLRLLELNTDTAFNNNTLSVTEYSDFINLLSTSNITEVDVIYKSFQENFVNHLSESLASNATFITKFTKHLQDSNTIYPDAIEDADNKFILRCSYDESAIFDSTYCKDSKNLYKLFSDNNDTTTTPGFYYSSSLETIDTLERTTNVNNIPDLVSKNIQNVHTSVEFYKVQGDGTDVENIDSFLQSQDEGNLITNYINVEGDLSHKSIRSHNIIYGSELSVVNLVDVEVGALFPKPDTLSISNNSNGKVDGKHYYELASNYPKFHSHLSEDGVFGLESLLKEDNTPTLIKDTVVGDKYQSMRIAGSPDSDLPEDYLSYFHSGSTPPETETTSSILVNKIKYELPNNLVGNIKVSGSDGFRASHGQPLFVYDTIDDGFRYHRLHNLDASRHKAFKKDGSLVDIESVHFEILEDSEDNSVYVIDMEETDTFILHNAEINISVVTHNACFPAGTKILLEGGDYKNIEEIKSGDVVVSYDLDNNEFTTGTVGSLNSSVQNKLIKVTTSDGNVVVATIGHLFHTHDGWKHAIKLNEHDILLNSKGEEVRISSLESIEEETTVYHLYNVGTHFNYFAENILVHNWSAVIQPDGPTCFSAGTRITLSNHDEKFIEDIIVGDEVLGWDGEKLVPSKVTAIDHRHNVGSHADACKVLGDEPSLYTINETGIEFTPEHPFLTKEGWKSLVPNPNQEPYKSQQEPKVLGLGDFIMVNGEWEEVKEVRVVRSNPDERVYNITVADLHSYVADGIVVHNKV